MSPSKRTFSQSANSDSDYYEHIRGTVPQDLGTDFGVGPSFGKKLSPEPDEAFPSWEIRGQKRRRLGIREAAAEGARLDRLRQSRRQQRAQEVPEFKPAPEGPEGLDMPVAKMHTTTENDQSGKQQQGEEVYEEDDKDEAPVPTFIPAQDPDFDLYEFDLMDDEQIADYLATEKDKPAADHAGSASCREELSLTPLPAPGPAGPSSAPATSAPAPLAAGGMPAAPFSPQAHAGAANEDYEVSPRVTTIDLTASPVVKSGEAASDVQSSRKRKRGDDEEEEDHEPKEIGPAHKVIKLDSGSEESEAENDEEGEEEERAADAEERVQNPEEPALIAEGFASNENHFYPLPRLPLQVRPNQLSGFPASQDHARKRQQLGLEAPEHLSYQQRVDWEYTNNPPTWIRERVDDIMIRLFG